ncbi:myotrophin isoform X1 [Leptinotarsa decemlineata]|uniref:myotrophin isoform X1 n=1 Tax=Leptinotarsa decemlineata TaxID=7539 RepID=UPI000C251980|nr:myotrophin-like isoform X1 [Leptinotarsa decemlineata]XP_023025056.1 myotrophin-like isoform X1 [Leptinotarsa decemlineata]
MSGDFVWAIKNGDLEQVKDIIEKKIFQSVNVNDEVQGRPLILYAADYGQTDVIEYLISAGADVNSKDKFGITALLAAIWEGHKDCVKLLLEKGARKDGVAPDGKTYLESAENNEIRQLLSA